VAFVRSKTVKGQTYSYLVENRWEEGKTRQRVLLYLGHHATVKAAYRFWSHEARTEKDSKRKKYATQMVKKLEPYL